MQPIGKYQFCHDIEVDRVAFQVEFVTPHKVVALVNDASGAKLQINGMWF
jgi:hypothetical protein